MRLLFYFFSLLLFFISFNSCKHTHEAQHSVTTEQPLFQADPTIFYQNNHYYLFGTNEANADSGYKVFVSPDLQHWHGKKEDNGYALTVNQQTFGTRGFWAPQVFVYNNQFFMAYTANEHIAIAQSNSPAGPFTQKNIAPVDTSVKQIDPFIFFDNDGKKYLYHVRLQNGNRIFGEELNDDLTVKPNTARECISAVVDAQPWENTETVNWTVTEGPTVIRRGNTYYLFYSANDFRNPDYAVGYATAKTPLGPWKKSDQNPIISRRLMSINGTGHGDILKDKTGNFFYVFHTHFSNEKVGPRKTAIIKLSFAADGSVSVDKNSFHYLNASLDK